MRSLCSILYGFAFGGLAGVSLYAVFATLASLVAPATGAPPFPSGLAVFAALAVVYMLVWDIFYRKEQSA